MGIPSTGPAVKNHLSPKMAKESIAIWRTMYHFVFPGLSANSSTTPTPTCSSSSSQDSVFDVKRHTEKIQYPKEVEVRVESFGETRCMNPQKLTTKIEMVNQKKYKEIYRMNCLIGCRNSGSVVCPFLSSSSDDHPLLHSC